MAPYAQHNFSYSFGYDIPLLSKEAKGKSKKLSYLFEIFLFNTYKNISFSTESICMFDRKATQVNIF